MLITYRDIASVDGQLSVQWEIEEGQTRIVLEIRPLLSREEILLVRQTHQAED